MYKNIGKKIKGLAVATFIITAVASFIGAIGLLLGESEELLIWGIVLMIMGPVLAWVSSWLIYGFGELIEKTTEIADNTAKLGSLTKVICKNCGTEIPNDGRFCTKCGTPRE